MPTNSSNLKGNFKWLITHHNYIIFIYQSQIRDRRNALFGGEGEEF